MINILFVRVKVLICLFLVAGVMPSYALQSEADTVAQKFGYVQFEVEPDTVYLYLGNDYKNAITLTDTTKIRLPVGGHRMVLFGKTLPDRRVNLTVKENDVQVYKVQKPNWKTSDDDFSAYAAFKWDANLMVFSDETTLISVMGTNEQSMGFLKAKIPPGAYRIQFEDEFGKVKDEYIEVSSFRLYTVEKYLKPKKGNSIVTAIVPGASQLYKGQKKKAAFAFASFGVLTSLAIHYDRRLGTETDHFKRVLNQYQRSTSESNALRLGDQLERMESDILSIKSNRNIFRAAAVLIFAVSFADAFREPKGGFADRNRFNPYKNFSVDLNPEFVEARVQINF